MPTAAVQSLGSRHRTASIGCAGPRSPYHGSASAGKGWKPLFWRPNTP